jgi:DNA-binding NtrC family response regulator
MAIILIVEDEEQIRILAESILQEHGHQTLSAATMDQAVALLESDQQIDILFTDIGLDDDREAGLRLARRAVELRPGLPVLYTTGQGVTDGMRAFFVEPFSFLAKPYTSETLQKAISIITDKAC